MSFHYYDTYAHNRAYEKQTHSIAMELSKISLSHNVTIEQIENSIYDYQMFATQLSCGNHDFTFIERIPMEDWREHYFYKSLVHTPDDDFRYINYDMRLLHDYVKIWQYVFHCVGFSFRDRFLDSKDILDRIPMFAEVFSVDTLVSAYSDGVPLEDLCVSD